MEQLDFYIIKIKLFFGGTFTWEALIGRQEDYGAAKANRQTDSQMVNQTVKL